jgi:hypothetical protein
MNATTFKKIGRRTLVVAAALIAGGYAASAAWKLSGSEQWKLEIDRDGVQVWSYKEPGRSTKLFKAVTRGHYTQSQLVASLMLDNDSLQNCKDWIPVCTKLTVLEPYNDKAQGDSVLWTLQLMPPVFADREYVIKSHAAQDPRTKVVSVDIMAAANKIALHECCVRITHIHNRWQVGPARNGQVEISLVQDFGMGGFFPDVLLNLGNAEQTWTMFHDKLPGLLNKPKYRNARFDYIDETAAAPLASR